MSDMGQAGREGKGKGRYDGQGEGVVQDKMKL